MRDSRDKEFVLAQRGATTILGSVRAPIMILENVTLTDAPWLEIWADLPPEERGDILRQARHRSFSKGTVVFSQGQDAVVFYVLTEGLLKVSQLTAEGQEIMVRIVCPGELFGIAAAIGRTDYPATTRAAMASAALCWDMKLWDRLIERHPGMARKALQTVGGRLEEARAQLRELSTERVEQRVAHALCRLVERCTRLSQRAVEIDFPLSRQDVAQLTGTTLHTVSRIVTRWRRAGLVESGRQRIRIRDVAALRKLAQPGSD